MQVRWMIRRDMPQVLDIESRTFGDAWGEDAFVRLLKCRNVIGLVAERDDTIYGYTLYEMLPGNLEVLNFAVDPKQRRQGIGTTLIEKLKTKVSLNSAKRRQFTLTVKDINLPMQLFLKSNGLTCNGILNEEYADGSDGYRFVWRAGDGS